MKRNLRLVSLLAFSLAVGLTAPSFAQSAAGNSGTPSQTHSSNWRRGMRAFRLGVCVGQTLATQTIPVILPKPQPGQQPTPPDAATKAAFDAAVQLCIAQSKGTHPGFGNPNGGTTTTPPTSGGISSSSDITTAGAPTTTL